MRKEIFPQQVGEKLLRQILRIRSPVPLALDELIEGPPVSAAELVHGLRRGRVPGSGHYAPMGLLEPTASRRGQAFLASFCHNLQIHCRETVAKINQKTFTPSLG